MESEYEYPTNDRKTDDNNEENRLNQAEKEPDEYAFNDFTMI